MELSMQIINSNSPWFRLHCDFDDALLDDGWIGDFLNRNGFPGELLACSGKHKLLMHLRTLLTDAMNAVLAGREPPENAIAGLNMLLAASPMHYEIVEEGGRSRLELQPQNRDWNYVLARVAASFIQMIGERDAGRFKRCENSDCLSVFYDFSRNQTRKWCCGGCASLIKVRRFREKQKETGDI